MTIAKKHQRDKIALYCPADDKPSPPKEKVAKLNIQDSRTKELHLRKKAWRRAKPDPRHLTTFFCRGDRRTERVKLSFLKERRLYSSMCPQAVLRKDVSDISILGSWDWTVFDVFSFKSDPQRNPSRVIAEGGVDTVLFCFWCLLGFLVGSLSASLLFFLLATLPLIFEVFPAAH